MLIMSSHEEYSAAVRAQLARHTEVEWHDLGTEAYTIQLPMDRRPSPVLGNALDAASRELGTWKKFPHNGPIHDTTPTAVVFLAQTGLLACTMRCYDGNGSFSTPTRSITLELLAHNRLVICSDWSSLSEQGNEVMVGKNWIAEKCRILSSDQVERDFGDVANAHVAIALRSERGILGLTLQNVSDAPTTIAKFLDPRKRLRAV